jgi:hypothetical protein
MVLSKCSRDTQDSRPPMPGSLTSRFSVRTGMRTSPGWCSSSGWPMRGEPRNSILRATVLFFADESPVPWFDTFLGLMSKDVYISARTELKRPLVWAGSITLDDHESRLVVAEHPQGRSPYLTG